MAASRETSPATIFSIKDILQEEKRAKTNKDVKTVTCAHDFEEITDQNDSRTPEPIASTASQHCVTAGNPSEISFLPRVYGFTRQGESNIGLKN